MTLSLTTYRGAIIIGSGPGAERRPYAVQVPYLHHDEKKAGFKHVEQEAKRQLLALKSANPGVEIEIIVTVAEDTAIRVAYAPKPPAAD